MRSLPLVLLALSACDGLPLAHPRPQPDAGLEDTSLELPDAADVVDASVPLRTCDEGVIVLASEGTLVSLTAHHDAWGLTYTAGDQTYFQGVDAEGRLLAPATPVSHAARVIRFGEDFLLVDAEGAMEVRASDGALRSVLEPLPPGEVMQVGSIDAVTAMVVLGSEGERTVYRVSPDGATASMVLPLASHSMVAMSADQLLDLTIEEGWDARPDLRLYGLSRAGAVLLREERAWSVGPNSLAAVHYQDGVFRVLGGVRDPESRFHRGVLLTLDGEAISFGAPPSLSEEEGAYYAVGGALAGDAPLGVVLEGSMGVLVEEGRLLRAPHGLDSTHVDGSSHPVRPSAIAFTVASQRFGLVGNVGPTLVLRCDLRSDGTHADFDPRAL